MIVVIAGIVLMLYPYISEYFFENRVDSEIMAYKECINKTVDQQYQRMLEQAEEYNSYLQKSQMQLTDPFANTGGTEEQPVYESLLRVDDSGIIGYVEIPTIGVKLPVYQGTSAGDLERGVGHLKGSSTPCGRKGNTCCFDGTYRLKSGKAFVRSDRDERGRCVLYLCLGQTACL